MSSSVTCCATHLASVIQLLRETNVIKPFLVFRERLTHCFASRMGTREYTVLGKYRILNVKTCGTHGYHCASQG